MAPHKKDPKITPDQHLNHLMEEVFLQQEKEKARQAFSQRVARIGTFTWDVKSGKSTWNQEFEALFGFPKKNFDGSKFESWLKLVHPDDRKHLHESIITSLQSLEVEMDVEYRVIWPNNTVHYLITRARIIRNARGEAIEVSGANIDITERKQLETNLHYLSEASKILASSLNYNETLISIAKLGVPEIADWCGVDILDENNAVKRIAVAHTDPKKVKLGWKLTEIDPIQLKIRGGVSDVLNTGKSVFFQKITKEMLLQNAKSKKHLSLLKKLNFCSVMVVPLIVENRTIGAVSFISAESLRHFTHADLVIAEEVASRASIAIHNARLFTDAQNAISIRDEFISVASHELKTPITSLKMYTQIVLRQIETRGDNSLLDPLSKMNAQIDKLTLLINDLLNISRIQLGKLEFNEELFDMQKVVKDTIESIQSGIHSHAINLHGTVTKKVWGDKDRLGQVITNLLTNAIKYSPRAHQVDVTIREHTYKVEISVKDYGIGIDQNQQHMIFNRFYRVSGLEEKTFPGLGIGLYISSEIVKRHNGDIKVKSQKGKGSEFSFTIPFNKRTK